MKEFKRVGKILMKGMWRMICGAATTAMIGLSVYGFANIASEDGYVAVFDFIGAVVVLAMAIGFMFALGGGKKRRGGFER